MKILILLLLAGCTCPDSWNPDPYPWLHSRRYEPYHLELIPPNVVGDSTCPANWVGWSVDAKRVAIPEEPCAYIRSKVAVCCPPSGREPCHGRELEAMCVKEKK